MPTFAFMPIRTPLAVLQLTIPALVENLQPEDTLAVCLDGCEVTEADIIALVPIGLNLLFMPVPQSAAAIEQHEGHDWTSRTASRLAAIKNAALDEAARKRGGDTFLLDADVLIQPGTIQSLRKAGHNIASALYWTHFKGLPTYFPNCWDYPHYGFRGPESILRLAKPGMYRVGGLGACTLVSNRVLQHYPIVNFKAIPSVSDWWEDRQFCMRAEVAGFGLYCNSELPAFHIYNPETDINLALEWQKAPASWLKENWLTAEWEAKVRRLWK